MPSRIMIIAAILLVGAAGGCKPSPQKLTIRPGPVTKNKLGRLESYFDIGPPTKIKYRPGDIGVTYDEPWKFSLGTAGACLLADLNPAGYPRRDPREEPEGRFCSSDAQCAGGWPDSGALDSDPDKRWGGYCVQNRCMGRPPRRSEFCTLSPVHNEGQPWPKGRVRVPFASQATTLGGPVKGLDVSDIYALMQGKPIRWVLWGCLNEYDPKTGTDAPACANGPDDKRIYRAGPISTVP